MMKISNLPERRYDIDWLRVITIGMLLVYHSAIGFQPWGALIRFIQNDQFNEPIWMVMSMMNIWRIPLLFVVSGMGVWFAMQRRSWKPLIAERSKRILLPFLVGLFCWVPLHQNLWQHYYSQPILYFPNPGHLWFLGNIFIYVLILTPAFYLLETYGEKPSVKRFQGIINHPMFLVLLIILFVIESELISPESFELYAMTWHGFCLGMVAFIMGFLMAFSGTELWQTLSRYRWLSLGIAIMLYLIRVIYFELRTPDFLMSIESCLWIYAVLGLGFQYLNRSSKVLSYLSQAAYPIYIIHMMLLYLGSILIFPTQMSPIMKLILLLLFTFGSCFLIYELIIRRIKFLRPLFGLKP